MIRIVRNLLSLKCRTLMTFTTCSFRPVLPEWPHASSHHLEVLALRNLRFQNLLLENNLQTFPLSLQLFLFPPLGSRPPMIPAASLALLALLFVPHADLLRVSSLPSPKATCALTGWLGPCCHSTTQQIFIEFLLCENPFAGPSAWHVSLLSAPTPSCKSYTSFQIQSWRHII